MKARKEADASGDQAPKIIHVVSGFEGRRRKEEEEEAGNDSLLFYPTFSLSSFQVQAT